MTPDQSRLVIAQRAAKLIADGLDDFQLARNKAAKGLNLPSAAALPDHADIDRALAEHHALFGTPERLLALRRQREVAAQFMRQAEPFSPRLYGTVLSGTAMPGTAIRLELALEQDESKELEIFLLNAGWPFELRSYPGSRRSEYEIRFRGETLLVSLSGARHRQPNRAWHDRATLTALSALLEQDAGQNANAAGHA
jgi:hypothetical protein